MTRWIFAVAAVVAALALGADPAFAGLPVADLHVKKVGKPFEGDDVINLTAEDQTVKKLANPAAPAKFKFRVENDGDSGTVVVRGNGSDSEFRVRYRDAMGGDITEDMIAGTVDFVLAADEEGPPIKILVTPKSAAPLGAKKTVKVTAEVAASDQDRVKAKVENGLPGE